MSLWRLQKLFALALRHAIIGVLVLEELLREAPRLLRLLRDTPRQRRSQATAASAAAKNFRNNGG